MPGDIGSGRDFGREWFEIESEETKIEIAEESVADCDVEVVYIKHT